MICRHYTDCAKMISCLGPRAAHFTSHSLEGSDGEYSVWLPWSSQENVSACRLLTVASLLWEHLEIQYGRNFRCARISAIFCLSSSNFFLSWAMSERHKEETGSGRKRWVECHPCRVHLSGILKLFCSKSILPNMFRCYADSLYQNNSSRTFLLFPIRNAVKPNSDFLFLLQLNFK